MTILELYVIRHGQTIVNKLGLINSRNIIGINANGKKEAEIDAKQLENIKLDLIICSPLRRTKQTCKILNKNKLKVLYDERILERDSRSMQFKKISALDLNEWYDINKKIVYKNSEGFKSILQRVESFLKEIKEKYSDKNILLVTHGDICKAIYALLNDCDNVKEISSFNQKNCEIKKYIIK